MIAQQKYAKAIYPNDTLLHQNGTLWYTSVPTNGKMLSFK